MLTNRRGFFTAIASLGVGSVVATHRSSAHELYERDFRAAYQRIRQATEQCSTSRMRDMAKNKWRRIDGGWESRKSTFDPHPWTLRDMSHFPIGTVVEIERTPDGNDLIDFQKITWPKGYPE